jgi:hypothetical protein
MFALFALFVGFGLPPWEDSYGSNHLGTWLFCWLASGGNKDGEDSGAGRIGDLKPCPIGGFVGIEDCYLFVCLLGLFGKPGDNVSLGNGREEKKRI